MTRENTKHHLKNFLMKLEKNGAICSIAETQESKTAPQTTKNQVLPEPLTGNGSQLTETTCSSTNKTNLCL